MEWAPRARLERANRRAAGRLLKVAVRGESGRLCTGRCARLDGVSGVITLSPECRGLAGVLCLSLGSGSLAGGIVGRVHRDDRRPEVETGAPQVAAPT
jgi:hypothetical protein